MGFRHPEQGTEVAAIANLASQRINTDSTPHDGAPARSRLAARCWLSVGRWAAEEAGFRWKLRLSST